MKAIKSKAVKKSNKVKSAVVQKYGPKPIDEDFEKGTDRSGSNTPVSKIERTLKGKKF